jgi:hypothetical protein
MNDKLIFSDGSTLYITLESKVQKWVRGLLIMVNIVLFCIPILLLATASKEEIGKVFFGVLAMSSAFIFFVTIPTLWNIFGRECMVITTDNFSYYRDFGIYKTQVKNIPIANGLAAYIQNELVYADEPYVVITFCEYLPNEEYREILTTSIKTPEKNYKAIQEYLNEIFKLPENPYRFSLN